VARVDNSDRGARYASLDGSASEAENQRSGSLPRSRAHSPATRRCSAHLAPPSRPPGPPFLEAARRENTDPDTATWPGTAAAGWIRQQVRPGTVWKSGECGWLRHARSNIGLRAPFGPWGCCSGFVIEATHRAYFAGDTQAFAAMRSLGQIDVALMPIVGPCAGPSPHGSGRFSGGTTPDSTAGRETHPLGSLLPMGLHRRAWSYLIGPQLDFVERMRLELPDVHVMVLQPGESFASGRYAFGE
jgi:hypothetical protein